MGTSTDRQGVPVTGSVEAITAYDRAIDHLQRFQIDMVEAATDSIDADPTFAMGHLMLVEMTLMSTDGGDHGGAQELLAAAEGIAADGSLAPCELAHLDAVRRWVAGDMAGAGKVLDQLVFEEPLDVLALVRRPPDRLLQRRRGEPARPRRSGAAGMGPRGPSLRLPARHARLRARGVEPLRPLRGGGRRAVDTNANDVWGIHAVVHTYEMQGRVPDGVRYFQERWDDWAEANFLNVHNSWHNALYLLQGEEPERALEVYDRVLHHDGSEDLSLELLDAQRAALAHAPRWSRRG